MKRKLVSMVFIVLCGMLMSGCRMAGREFGFNGMPKEQYRVGGGFSIEYTAPQNGICYLVDQGSGRFLMTKGVEAEDTFDISLSDGTDQEKLKAMGIDMSKARLVLYFVPNPVQKEQ